MFRYQVSPRSRITDFRSAGRSFGVRGDRERGYVMSESEEHVAFSPEHEAPIPYLERIRDYYQVLGYGTPYRWAHYAEVPFAPLTKKLRDSRIALVTTAAPYRPENGDQGPGAPYDAAAKFYAVYSGDSE